MKNIGSKAPKIKAENLIYFGVVIQREAEDKQIDKLKIRNYMVDEVRLEANLCS
jgi:arginase